MQVSVFLYILLIIIFVYKYNFDDNQFKSHLKTLQIARMTMLFQLYNACIYNGENTYDT